MDNNLDEIKKDLDRIYADIPKSSSDLRTEIMDRLSKIEVMSVQQRKNNKEIAFYVADKIERDLLPDKGEVKRYDVPNVGWFTIDSNGLLVDGSQQLYKDFLDGKFNAPKKPVYNPKKVTVGILIMVPLTVILIIKTFQGIQNTLIKPAVNAVEWLHSDWNNTRHWSK